MKCGVRNSECGMSPMWNEETHAPTPQTLQSSSQQGTVVAFQGVMQYRQSVAFPNLPLLVKYLFVPVACPSWARAFHGQDVRATRGLGILPKPRVRFSRGRY
jgi:hypothetical protein